MKTITKSVIALLTVLAIACSPDDVEDRPVIEGIDSPVLVAPEGANVYILLPENMDQQAERFVWSSANYDNNIEVSYEVQMDNTGNDFASPQILGGAVNANQLSVSVEVMNNAALALGAEPYEPIAFEVRVVSSANGAIPMYSNVVTISVTPYTTETPKLWIPGGYQSDSGYGENWAHATAPMLASEAFGNASFEGYVYIATNQFDIDNSEGFKFSTQANWDGTNYGDDGTVSGMLAADGDNIAVAAGYYRMQANTTTLTYSLQPTSWGIVGNATPGGWDNSTPMTYDPDSKTWKITVALTAQNAPDDGWKFRANNSWDINLGDTTLNSTDGTLVYGGTNISVPSSGTYVIELDLSNPRAYTYTITLE